jgi:tetratricopeptide (TPR) repeat protein
MKNNKTTLRKIDKLISRGEYIEALKSIEVVLGKKDISKLAKLESKFLYYQKGKCLECLGKFEEAISILNIAENIEIQGDLQKTLEAKIKAAIGASKYELGEYEDSLGILSKAFDLLRDTSENREIANIQKYLGWCYLCVGKLKTAKEFLEDSISTFRRVGENIEVAVLKNYLARIYLLKADWKNAIELYEDAIEIRRSQKKFKGIEFYFTNKGTALMFLGDFKEALHSFKKSIRLSKKFKNNFTIIHNCLLIGKLYHQKHLYSKSEEFLAKGLALAREKGMKREIGKRHEA